MLQARASRAEAQRRGESKNKAGAVGCVPSRFGLILALISLLCVLPAAAAEQPKPATLNSFTCYVQHAEGRMSARQAFLVADGDSAMNEELVRGQKIVTVAGEGANPHHLPGGLAFDWVGTVFIPGAKLDRTVRMLQDYDHRAQYFADVMSSSKLLCHTGRDHFVYTMRLKEPAVIDVKSDVVWEQTDAHRWRCRSYSLEVGEVGKDHGYLRRLDSYWRFAEVPAGVYVEGETITLSDEFGGLARSLGSLMGINPEKSLRRSLNSIRETVLQSGLEFPAPPSDSPDCGAPFHPGGCSEAPAK